jgi:hypothetical protein
MGGTLQSTTGQDDDDAMAAVATVTMMRPLICGPFHIIARINVSKGA